MKGLTLEKRLIVIKTIQLFFLITTILLLFLSLLFPDKTKIFLFFFSTTGWIVSSLKEPKTR